MNLVRLVLLFLLPSLLLAGDWETLEGCRYVTNDYNDGDSFHVSHGKENFIVRLYFVDTPETDQSNRGGPQRVAEQAAHFWVSEDSVMNIGRYAKQATAQMLSRPFTVLTEGRNAMGNSAGGRIYAFVETADGKDLAAELVRNGLARSHGQSASSPKKSAADLRAMYDQLEDRAKRARVGAYSKAPGTAIAREDVEETPRTQEPRENRSEGTLVGPEINMADVVRIPVPAVPVIQMREEEKQVPGEESAKIWQRWEFRTDRFR